MARRFVLRPGPLHGDGHQAARPCAWPSCRSPRICLPTSPSRISECAASVADKHAALRFDSGVRAQIKTAGSELALATSPLIYMHRKFDGDRAGGDCSPYRRAIRCGASTPGETPGRGRLAAGPGLRRDLLRGGRHVGAEPLEGPPDQLDELKRLVESRRPRWLQDERSAEIVPYPSLAQADGGGGARRTCGFRSDTRKC